MLNKILVYTDGASRSNGSEDAIGARTFSIEIGKDVVIEKSSAIKGITNNQAEMTAIINALEELKNYKDHQIEIFSDSAYCINGINDWVHGWIRKDWINSSKKPVENKELWQYMYKLRSEFKNLSFTKIKGHSGIEGNERADFLCNIAMNNYSEAPTNLKVRGF